MSGVSGLMYNVKTQSSNQIQSSNEKIYKGDYVLAFNHFDIHLTFEL
jgi:hypothetical protein